MIEIDIFDLVMTQIFSFAAGALVLYTYLNSQDRINEKEKYKYLCFRPGCNFSVASNNLHTANEIMKSHVRYSHIG